MNGFFIFLIILGYIAAGYSFLAPRSAWVAADRERVFWIIWLVIPGINAFTVIAYAAGVVPMLITHHQQAMESPFRLGGPGGRASGDEFRPA